MVQNRQTGDEITVRPPSKEQRIVKGVPISVGAKLQPKDRSPPYMGEAVASLALSLYHTPPRFYKAK